MKKSEQSKTLKGEDGVDMISNLPDHILLFILSRIQSTEEVIQTSVLSTRWRYLWTSVPFIDIDYSPGLNPLEELESNGFKEFVYWVLLNKPHDLDSFRLWCANYYNMSTIRRWIHAAVVRKVKLLDLMFCPIEGSNVIEVPFCLVNCGSLEVLRLCLMGCHLSLPKFTGFPALRVLELNDVELEKGDLVKYFLEGCPLLEDLSLLHCHAYDLIVSCPKLKNLRVENGEIVFDEETEEVLDNRMSLNLQISCPKLVFLNLIGSLAYDFLFENLYSLKKAVIHIKDFFDSEEPTFDVFDELSHLESLSISLYCVGQINKDMKKSKIGKAPGCKDGVDMISNLPDPILHMILSALPTTEEVIRTSILSTRWRYLWTSVPSIDIDYSRRMKPLRIFEKKKFEEFVYSVLVNNSLNLDCFRICCSDHYSLSTIRRWIHAAVMRKVKLLDLMFCPREEYEDIELPHLLVTCGSLEILRLSLFGHRLILPKFKGFPSLRVLELNNVDLFDDNIVKEFLKSCPLLEDLSLKDCLLDKLGVLCISCPNLKNLYIGNLDGIPGVDYQEVEGSGDGPSSIQICCPKLVFLELTSHIAYYTFFFESPDSLKKVVIHGEKLKYDYIDNSICEFFVGISHVESLSLSHHFFIQCSDLARQTRQDFPEILPNLKTLELAITINVFTIDAIIKILKCSPNLESLHLTIEQIPEICIKYGLLTYNLGHPTYQGPSSMQRWRLDEAETRKILTCCLKKVKFLEFYGRDRELVIVRSLLEHGNALEEMVFGWGNEVVYHERSIETMKELSKFHKASPTVKLVPLLRR